MNRGFEGTSGKRLLAAVSSVALMLTPVLVSAEEGDSETGDVVATGTGAAAGVSVAQATAAGDVAAGYIAGGAVALGAGLCIAFCGGDDKGGFVTATQTSGP